MASVPLGTEEMKKVKAVYKRLTDENLLGRCLQGKTQNPNESLHSRVWKLCPKIKSLGKVTVDFSVAQAVISYIIGYKAGYLGKELGITSDRIVNLLDKMDKTREAVRVSKPRKKRKTAEVGQQYSLGEY